MKVPIRTHLLTLNPRVLLKTSEVALISRTTTMTWSAPRPPAGSDHLEGPSRLFCVPDVETANMITHKPKAIFEGGGAGL